MPYIKQHKRIYLQSILDLMKDLNISLNGELNYILFSYFKYIWSKAPSYNKYKEMSGELHACLDEIYRILVAPYEDKKREENGDI